MLTGSSAGHLNADRKYMTVTPVAHNVHMLVHVKGMEHAHVDLWAVKLELSQPTHSRSKPGLLSLPSCPGR